MARNVSAPRARLPVPPGLEVRESEDVGREVAAFFEAAVETGVSSVFTQYAAWLSVVMSARGKPGWVEETLEGLRVGLDEWAAEGREGVLLDEAVSAARRASRRAEPAPLGEHARRLLDAYLGGRGRDVDRALREALDAGLSARRLAEEVVQPAMTEVGRLWEENAITVADEHVGTALLQRSLARFERRRAEGDAPRGRAVLACVAGNRHSLGLRLVADRLEDEGYEVDFLGADVPTRDLVARVRATRPALVGLSLSLPPQALVARRVVEALREDEATLVPRVVLGGRAVEEHPELAEFVGASRGGEA